MSSKSKMEEFHSSMPTSPETTRQKILDAAALVFSEHGYTGATTRAIAALAGVNGVTLFRHFGNKKSLFQAMIQRNSALPGMDAVMRNSLTGDARQDLLTLAAQFLRTMLSRRHEILMSLAEAERLPEMKELIAFVPAQQRMMLGNYLKGQMDRGLVRTMDPELAAQALLGMLLAYSISLGLLPASMAQMPPEEVASQFVGIILDGIRP